MSLSLSGRLTDRDRGPWRAGPPCSLVTPLPSWGEPLGFLAVRGRLPYPRLRLRFVPRYLKYTLDQHVESDYTIVYFHCGLSSQNKPSLRWLQDAYQEFDRKCVPASPPVLRWSPGRLGRGSGHGTRGHGSAVGGGGIPGAEPGGPVTEPGIVGSPPFGARSSVQCCRLGQGGRTCSYRA